MALAVVAIFTIIQWIGVRAGGAVQNVTSIVKALALLRLHRRLLLVRHALAAGRRRR